MYWAENAAADNRQGYTTHLYRMRADGSGQPRLVVENSPLFDVGRRGLVYARMLSRGTDNEKSARYVITLRRGEQERTLARGTLQRGERLTELLMSPRMMLWIVSGRPSTAYLRTLLDGPTFRIMSARGFSDPELTSRYLVFSVERRSEYRQFLYDYAQKQLLEIPGKNQLGWVIGHAGLLAYKTLERGGEPADGTWHVMQLRR